MSRIWSYFLVVVVCFVVLITPCFGQEGSTIGPGETKIIEIIARTQDISDRPCPLLKLTFVNQREKAYRIDTAILQNFFTEIWQKPIPLRIDGGDFEIPMDFNFKIPWEAEDLPQVYEVRVFLRSEGNLHKEICRREPQGYPCLQIDTIFAFYDSIVGDEILLGDSFEGNGALGHELVHFLAHNLSDENLEDIIGMWLDDGNKLGNLRILIDDLGYSQELNPGISTQLPMNQENDPVILPLTPNGFGEYQFRPSEGMPGYQEVYISEWSNWFVCQVHQYEMLVLVNYGNGPIWQSYAQGGWK